MEIYFSYALFFVVIISLYSCDKDEISPKPNPEKSVSMLSTRIIGLPI